MRIDLQTGYFESEEYGFGRIVSMLDRRGRETLDVKDAQRAVVQLHGCDLRRELWLYLGDTEAAAVN